MREEVNIDFYDNMETYFVRITLEREIIIKNIKNQQKNRCDSKI